MNNDKSKNVVTMRFLQAAFVFAISALSIGCSTDTVRNIRPDDSVGKDSAIIVGRVITPTPDYVVMIHELEHELPSANVFMTSSQKKGRVYEMVFAMEADSGYVHYTNVKVGKLYARLFSNKNSPYYQAPPGNITYIGDLVTFLEATGVFKGKVIENREATLKEAKTTYPWLFERYPVNEEGIKKMSSELKEQK